MMRRRDTRVGRLATRGAGALLASVLLFSAADRSEAATCAGDCNGNDAVVINELVTLVNIGLGNAPVLGCSAGDVNQDGEISIDEIVAAVVKALEGCAAKPTPTPAPCTADSCRPCTAADTLCLPGQGGTYCCTLSGSLFADLTTGCQSSGIYDPTPTSMPNGCWTAPDGPCHSEYICFVANSPTPTYSFTPTVTVTPTVTTTLTAPSTGTVTATPTATPTVQPCNPTQASECMAVCGTSLLGCCFQPTPTGTPGSGIACFDPSIPCPGPDGTPCGDAGYANTACGGPAANYTDACQIEGTPAATGTATPTGMPTGTATAMVTVTATGTPIAPVPTTTATSTSTPGGPTATPTPPPANSTPTATPTPTPSGPALCPSGYRAFTFFNNCRQDIWPAAQNLNTNNGSVNGWHMPPPPAQCGQSSDCASGDTCVGGRCAYTACVPNGNQSATFWARSNCQFDSGGACPQATPSCCDSGNCLVNGSGNLDCSGVGANNSDPTTLGEISLAQPTFNVDTYDVSIIDGFNIAIQITPQGTFATAPAGNAGVYWCQTPGCPGGACLGPNLGSCDWSSLISTCPPAQQFNGYISDSVVGCLSGHNTCSTGWPNPPNTAFPCTAAVSNAEVKCSTNDDCPALTGYNVTVPTPGSCDGVTCPANSVCTTTNKYLNTSEVICELSCQSGVCTGPPCTANPDSTGACPAGQQCCDIGTAGAGGQILGTFMVCDLDQASTTYQTCVASTASLFLNTGINGQSCYNDFAATTCSGCPTDAQDPLHTQWPTTATSSCINDNDNWSSIVGPSLAAFKQLCPTAYAFPFDDPTSTFSCQGSGDSLNNLDYEIVFCPSSD